MYKHSKLVKEQMTERRADAWSTAKTLPRLYIGIDLQGPHVLPAKIKQHTVQVLVIFPSSLLQDLQLVAWSEDTAALGENE